MQGFKEAGVRIVEVVRIRFEKFRIRTRYSRE